MAQYQLISYEMAVEPEIEQGKESDLLEKVEAVLKGMLSLARLKQVLVLAGEDIKKQGGVEQTVFRVFTLIPTEDGIKEFPDPWCPDDPVLEQTLRDNLIVHSQFD